MTIDEVPAKALLTTDGIPLLMHADEEGHIVLEVPLGLQQALVWVTLSSTPASVTFRFERCALCERPICGTSSDAAVYVEARWVCAACQAALRDAARGEEP